MHTSPSLEHAYACILGNNINLNGDFLTAGAQAIRVVDPTTKNSTLVAQLDRTRVGVTLATLGNGKILILGGNQQVCISNIPILMPFAEQHN